MFGHGSHANDISRQLDALKADVVRLGEALAEAAEDRSRGPRRQAARYAGRMFDAAEDQASYLASNGLSMAREGGRAAAEHLARTAHRAERVVAENPGRAVVAAAAVGLTVGALLFAFSGSDRRR
ncbi:hypothetical protein [Azorhizobium caulinodans]|nr:hypothetical protein [Azorhizobium caulinodans]